MIRQPRVVVDELLGWAGGRFERIVWLPEDVPVDKLGAVGGLRPRFAGGEGTGKADRDHQSAEPSSSEPAGPPFTQLNEWNVSCIKTLRVSRSDSPLNAEGSRNTKLQVPKKPPGVSSIVV